jgi:UDP-N-acetylmuramate dehydrogenase
MGELLSDHTTLRLGGPADRFLTHADPAAWPEIAQTVRSEGMAPFVLGGGSNTLAADAGFPGTVIRMATRGIAVHVRGRGMVEVVVQAGEPLASLVAFTVTEGLSGIEYLGGIPGTTGASPVQNTGAYGQQISDTLAGITVHDWLQSSTSELRPEDADFGYRTSIFKTHPGRWTILAITLRLTRSALAAPVTYRPLIKILRSRSGARPPLAEASRAVLCDRATRGLILPTVGPDARQAGSVFLNPVLTPHQESAVRAAGGPIHRDNAGHTRGSAGWLLEQIGHLPGSRVGNGVYCSTNRTLTLTARPPATATSFRTALQALADDVHSAFGIELRPEPTQFPEALAPTRPRLCP